MTPELFLELLTRHNTLIIQVLVTIVLVISAFVIYRIYVAGDAAEGEGGVGTQHLEKTLQKFLEMQSAGGVKTEGAAAAPAAAGGGGDVEKLREEILQARAAIKEKDEKLAALEAQAGNSGGLSAEEKAKYEAKIHDLEQRLAEYEIIAEDIADLARYREENIKLKEELQKLKGGGDATAAAPAAETAAPAQAPEAAPVAAAPQAAPSAEPAPSTEPAAAPTPEAQAAAPAAPSTETPAVTDELMAEFEAAVVQQKEASAEAQAVPGSEIPEADRKQMLDDFESFVKKS